MPSASRRAPLSRRPRKLWFLSRMAIATLAESGGAFFWQAAQNLATLAGVGLLCLLHCAKMRRDRAYGNFLPGRTPITKLTVRPHGIASAAVLALCVAQSKPI